MPDGLLCSCVVCESTTSVCPLPPLVLAGGIEVTCAVHCGPRTTPSGLVVARSGSPVLTQLVLKSRHSVAVTSVSTNGPPTSYQHVPNCRCAYADLVSAQVCPFCGFVCLDTIVMLLLAF